jgi:hypothetical protein
MYADQTIPNIVSVPVKEVGGTMNGRSHVHVDDNKVIIASLSSRIFASGQLAWLFKNALHCPNVLLLLVLCEVATKRIVRGIAG